MDTTPEQAVKGLCRLMEGYESFSSSDEEDSGLVENHGSEGGQQHTHTNTSPKKRLMLRTNKDLYQFTGAADDNTEPLEISSTIRPDLVAAILGSPPKSSPKVITVEDDDDSDSSASDSESSVSALQSLKQNVKSMLWKGLKYDEMQGDGLSDSFFGFTDFGIIVFERWGQFIEAVCGEVERRTDPKGTAASSLSTLVEEDPTFFSVLQNRFKSNEAVIQKSLYFLSEAGQSLIKYEWNSWLATVLETFHGHLTDIPQYVANDASKLDEAVQHCKRLQINVSFMNDRKTKHARRKSLLRHQRLVANFEGEIETIESQLSVMKSELDLIEREEPNLSQWELYGDLKEKAESSQRTFLGGALVLVESKKNSEMLGSLWCTFQPTIRQDGATFHSISPMQHYGNKSFDELRFEDYSRFYALVETTTQELRVCYLADDEKDLTDDEGDIIIVEDDAEVEAVARVLPASSSGSISTPADSSSDSSSLITPADDDDEHKQHEPPAKKSITKAKTPVSGEAKMPAEKKRKGNLTPAGE